MQSQEGSKEEYEKKQTELKQTEGDFEKLGWLPA
jgi:hypothetical protein